MAKLDALQSCAPFPLCVCILLTRLFASLWNIDYHLIFAIFDIQCVALYKGIQIHLTYHYIVQI